MTDQKKDRSLVERIAARFKVLERAGQTKLGKVASLSPLTVHIDGDLDDAEAPVATPVTLSMVSTLTVGQLVVCLEQDLRVTIINAQS